MDERDALARQIAEHIAQHAPTAIAHGMMQQALDEAAAVPAAGPGGRMRAKDGFYEGLDVRGDTATVGLWYPRTEPVKAIEVDLVRAADSIRVEYDFERDGWVIKQASRFEWEADDPDCDPDWQEVAFVGAWAREVPGPADEKAP